MSTPLLKVRDLRVHFATEGTVVRAVDGVDFELRAGETLALVGESGCGKSTLARALVGLNPITSGSAELEGRTITGLTRAAMRPFRRELQLVFQDPYASLNPRFTIAQTLAEPLLLHGKANRDNVDGEVCELLGQVGLDPELRGRYPHEFSGGQRQRISIARALAVEPRLLLCDEVTSALDVSIQAQILDLLRSVQQKLGLSYLFITHDLERILNPMLPAEMRSSRTRIGATRGSERLVAPSVRAGRESGCAKSLFVRRPSVAPCRVPCQSTAARRAVGCAVGFRAGESQGLRAGSRSLCRDTSVRGAAGREGHA